ncbi:hypothetical protein [Curtobacterium sp. MR_MD2014]|uniref:hypothetical protein n=1 Tax=Curtobacterium sp. MR_MD2014 TaxID=1561023 RepID=UPI00130E60E4|nr:hypothetical protein [Curtobacterium sp. MR_MD2014]
MPVVDGLEALYGFGTVQPLERLVEERIAPSGRFAALTAREQGGEAASAARVFESLRDVIRQHTHDRARRVVDPRQHLPANQVSCEVGIRRNERDEIGSNVVDVDGRSPLAERDDGSIGGCLHGGPVFRDADGCLAQGVDAVACCLVGHGVLRGVVGGTRGCGVLRR